MSDNYLMMQRALPCRLKLSPAPPLIGWNRMYSTSNLSANPSCLSFPKDDCRSWPPMTLSPSRLITFTGGALSPCSTEFHSTAKTVNGKELQMQETPKMTAYFWALLVLQIFSAISVGVLWYLMNLMTSVGRGGIKLWSFWLVGDQRISYISSLASKMAFFTLLLLGIGVAVCLIPLVKMMMGHL